MRHLHTLLLHVDGSCCAKFETSQTFNQLQTDATTPISCGPTMLRVVASDYRWFSRYVVAAMLVDGKQEIAH